MHKRSRSAVKLKSWLVVSLFRSQHMRKSSTPGQEARGNWCPSPLAVWVQISAPCCRGSTQPEQDWAEFMCSDDSALR